MTDKALRQLRHKLILRSSNRHTVRPRRCDGVLMRLSRPVPSTRQHAPEPDFIYIFSKRSFYVAQHVHPTLVPEDIGVPALLVISAGQRIWQILVHDVQ
jgi:hypothetical protein